MRRQRRLQRESVSAFPLSSVKKFAIMGTMETIIKKISTNELDQEAIRQAGQILEDGGLVAFPTETVYGLGANALDEEAARKTYEAKGRPSDNPLIVHIADIEALDDIVRTIPPEAHSLAQHFWPGPLTMIFEKSEIVPYGTTGGLDTVAVRMPANDTALALIRSAGGYVSAPSANTSGRPSPTEAAHVAEDLSGKIEMILDGGSVPIGVESTIVDMTVTPPMILRPGAVTKEMLEEVIGEVAVDNTLLTDKSGEAPKAPGMKYRHYAPKARLAIVEGEITDVVKAIRQLTYDKIRLGKGVGIIASNETQKDYTYGIIKTIGTRENEATVAKNLYRILREFDEEEVEYIYSEAFDADGIGTAVMNRLMKAAGHQVIPAAEIVKLQKFREIVFVSDSDNSRGPMAAELLRAQNLCQEYKICSRGMIVLFPEPANQKAEAIMKSKQLTLAKHQAKALDAEMITEETLVLTMSEEIKQKILAENESLKYIYTLKEFVREDGDVESPYGQPLASYGETYEELEDLIKKLTEKLNKEAEEQ